MSKISKLTIIALCLFCSSSFAAEKNLVCSRHDADLGLDYEIDFTFSSAQSAKTAIKASQDNKQTWIEFCVSKDELNVSTNSGTSLFSGDLSCIDGSSGNAQMRLGLGSMILTTNLNADGDSQFQYRCQAL